MGNYPSSLQKVQELKLFTQAMASFLKTLFLQKRCEEEGIVFIGPPSHVIAEMGSKIRARNLMMKAGVPVVPGTKDAVEDADEASEDCGRNRLSHLIKASAGGRWNWDEEWLTPEKNSPLPLSSTRQMAGSAFGDSSVFIENM